MKPKLLLIHSFYFPEVVGGAEISSKLLAEDLSKFYDVVVLTTYSGKEIIEEKVNGISVVRIPFRNVYWMNDRKKHNSFMKLIWHISDVFNPLQKSKVLKQIRTVNPDLIVTQNLIGIGTYVWKYEEAKVFHTIRDRHLYSQTSSKVLNSFFNIFHKIRSKGVYGVIGVSGSVLNDYISRGYFSNAKRIVIGNVVKGNVLKIKSKKLKNKPLKIGYFGRIDREKGIYQLLKAVDLLPDCEMESLYIVGEMTHENDLEINNGKIKYFGKQQLETVYQLMNDVDLVVVPSMISESFGRVVIEAYRQGAIVIASNLGGLEDLIVDKHLLLNKITPEEIAKKIDFVYKNEFDLKKYIDYSKKFEDNVDKYINFLESD